MLTREIGEQISHPSCGSGPIEIKCLRLIGDTPTLAILATSVYKVLPIMLAALLAFKRSSGSMRHRSGRGSTSAAYFISGHFST